MYQVDILTKNHQWEYFYSSEDIKKIDKVVWKLTNLRPNKQMRILNNNIVMCFLDGSEYQYWWFKNYYVRERSKEFDIVASYYEHQKKLEKTKEKKTNE